MANPNNIYKYSSRAMNVVFEETFTDKREAEIIADKMKASREYDRVKLSSFRFCKGYVLNDKKIFRVRPSKRLDNFKNFSGKAKNWVEAA
jgi:hypothetical protein